MKERITYIETSCTKYPICFNLNVMEEIQEKYGSLEKWGDVVEKKIDGEPNIKDLKEGLLIMINEGIDYENELKSTNNPLIDSKKVGRILGELGLNEVSNIIKNLTVSSTNIGEQEKNV